MKFSGLLRPRFGLFLCWLWSIHTLLPMAAEPVADEKELPRVPPTAPEQALKTFAVESGFHIELVAAEPLVMDPVAIAFDENGRLFVAEMRGYSERQEEHLGRIRLLEDTDGDGRYDKSTIFADGLSWPTGVICSRGGVFVADTLDILFLKDTNGDGVADVRQRVFTGFGAGITRLNVQQLFNGFIWGLDHRIHGANGGNGGAIAALMHPEDPVLNLKGRDFSFDSRSLQMRAESGGGQYGLSFDDRGREFVCSNSSHLREVMFDDRYVGLNPFYAPPAPSIDIATDGPAAEIFRISPDEPWRVLRTRWRVAGLVPGPIEGGGRPSGYFSAATGITIYRGDSWPEQFRGDAFVADCGANLVHRKKLLSDGVALKGVRPAGEEKKEFLASRDNWFRPVQLANGPDGALYIVDMYREVVEHPWSLPDSIKKHLDLNSGNDRGRIYRVVPDSFHRGAPPRLGEASVADLVHALGDPNGWRRDTAARLLYERQDRAALPLLESAARSPSALARLQALYALEGLDSLTPNVVESALNDADPGVREHALRLAETLWTQRPLPETVTSRLRELADDPDREVRYQLALSLGLLRSSGKGECLARIIQSDPGDPWIQAAVLNSSATNAVQILGFLLAQSGFVQSDGADGFLGELSRMIGVRSDRHEIGEAMAALTHCRSVSLACSLAAGLGDGLQHAGATLWSEENGPMLARLTEQAGALLADGAASERSRRAALSYLGQIPFSKSGTWIAAVLQPGAPAGLQRAAIRSLGRFAVQEVPGTLLNAWNALTPDLRAEAIDALLRRKERIPALLSAIESGQVHPSDLSIRQLDSLRKNSDPGLRVRVAKVLGAGRVGSRAAVIQRFLPALNLAGHAEHGHAIYLERCASCHRLAGEGHALGPDLETIRANGRATLLTNLLDPNREVLPKYVNYAAETTDGESLTGLVVAEDETSLRLRQPNDQESVVRRSQLRSLRSLGSSAMPEGLEEGLGPQDVADLLEYVLTATPAVLTRP